MTDKVDENSCANGNIDRYCLGDVLIDVGGNDRV
jgi:hypothetical protein